jgi:antitoxin HigA-1
MNQRIIPPPHPGEIISEDLMKPLGLSAAGLAAALGMSDRALEDILRGEAGITSELANRLAGHFGSTPGFWLNLQAHYDSAAVPSYTLV